MKYIDSYVDLRHSFWDTFPIFKLMPEFKELYKKDRSEGKHISSKSMWYLVFTQDIDSEFWPMDVEEWDKELPDVIGVDYFKFFGGKAKTREYELIFSEKIDTVLSRSVRLKELKMKERDKFIKDTPYSLDTVGYNEDEGGNRTGKGFLIKGTAADLDRMIVGTPKLVTEIKEMRESLREEDSAGSGKGGREASMLEKRG